MKTPAIALLAVLTLAGCTASDPGDDKQKAKKPKSDKPAASKCVKIKRPFLNSIAEGLKFDDVKILKGRAVKLPKADQAFGVTYIAALKVKGADSPEKVTLGIGSPTEGPIIAADNVARVFFDWGEAAQEDSPMGEYRDILFLTQQADTAKGCL